MPLFSLDDLAAAMHISSVDDLAGELLQRRVDAVVGAVTGPLSAVPPLVESIALDVAVRAYSNPNGYESETAGPFSYSRARGTTGGVYLTEAERRQIRTAVGRPLNSVPLVGYGLDDALR